MDVSLQPEILRLREREKQLDAEKKQLDVEEKQLDVEKKELVVLNLPPDDNR